MSIDTVLKIGGLLVIVVPATWTAGDYFGFRPALKLELAQLDQKLSTVSPSVLLNRFQFLEFVRQTQPLTFEQAQERCQIVEVLKLKNIQGC